MAAANGKLTRFFAGGREYPIQKVDYSADYNEKDQTDSTTNADGSESAMGRAKRTFKASGFLYTPNGAAITSGTLEVGKKYFVAAGTFAAGDRSYTQGMIFEAITAESCSETNQARLLGDIIPGDQVGITIGGNSVAIKSINYKVSYPIKEINTTNTPVGETNIGADRPTRATTLTLVMNSEVADLLTNDAIARNVVVSLGADQTITGVTKFKKVGHSTDVKGGYVIQTYDSVWQGVPELSPELAGVLPPIGNMVNSIKLVADYDTGGSGEKAYSGQGIIGDLEISGDVDSDVQVTYSGQFDGAVTTAIIS